MARSADEASLADGDDDVSGVEQHTVVCIATQRVSARFGELHGGRCLAGGNRDPLRRELDGRGCAPAMNDPGDAETDVGVEPHDGLRERVLARLYDVRAGRRGGVAAP